MELSGPPRSRQPRLDLLRPRPSPTDGRERPPRREHLLVPEGWFVRVLHPPEERNLVCRDRPSVLSFSPWNPRPKSGRYSVTRVGRSASVVRTQTHTVPYTGLLCVRPCGLKVLPTSVTITDSRGPVTTTRREVEVLLYGRTRSRTRFLVLSDTNVYKGIYLRVPNDHL